MSRKHLRWALLVCVASGALGGGVAHAAADVAATLPPLELRALVGTGAALEATAPVLSDRLLLEGAGAWDPWAKGPRLDGAVLGRFAGQATNGLWLRAGARVQVDDLGCVDDPGRSETLDAGLSYRYVSRAGSAFGVEAGVAWVHRARGFECRDSVLGGDSVGARVSLFGRWALTPRWGVFLRAGFRGGENILELHTEPEALLGLAAEL